MTILPASEWESGICGIFHGVTDAQYFAGTEVSHSLTKKARISMKTAKRSTESDDVDTEAKMFGRAVHLWKADEAEFNTRFAVAPTCQGRKGDGSACTNQSKFRSGGVWYCGVHGKGRLPDEGVESITEQQRRWMADWKEELEQKDAYAVQDLYHEGGAHEVAIRWIDEPTGLVCRAKFDYLWIENGVGYAHDYKTKAREITDSALSREINDRCYYSQEAFYRMGAKALGVEIADFRFVWFLKSAGNDPGLVRVDRIEPLAVAVGAEEVRGLLDKIAGCRLTGYWPGLDLGRVGTIDLPSWRRVDTEMAASAVEAAAMEYDDELPA